MSKKTFVSIILPVYNDENTVEVCLRTLIRQNYTDKEIIVVDDGSTDNTPTIISKMAKQHPSLVRVVFIPHGGASKTRNVGLKHAVGEIISFSESDAIYSREYIENAVKFLSLNPHMAGACLTGAPWILKSTLVTSGIYVENRIQRKLLEEEKIEPFYAWVFRKKVLEEIGGFDENLYQAEDRDLFSRIKRRGYQIGLVTGVYWQHKRDQNLWEFLRRCYLGGKTRILFIMKHRKITGFLRAVSLLWFLVIALLLLPFFPLFSLVALILLLAIPAIYKLFFALRLGWSCVEKRRYLLFFPIFFLLRHLANALGYTHGLLVVLTRKIQRKMGLSLF